MSDLNDFGNNLIALGTPDSQASIDYYANAENNRQAFTGVVDSSQNLYNAQVSPLTHSLSSQIGAQSAIAKSVGAFGQAGATFLDGQTRLNSLVPQMIQDQNATNKATLASFQNQIVASNAMVSNLDNNVAYYNYQTAQSSIQASVNAANQSAYASVNTPPPQTGGGGSFIVSAYAAYCESNNLAVNKNDIALMIRFKDIIVYNNKPWRKKLFVYYRVAPLIVAKINELDYKDEIYAYIWFCYLKPCAELLKQQKFEAAFDLYVNLVESCADIVALDLSDWGHNAN